MGLIKHTKEWVQGEVYQGKIMLILGMLVLTVVYTLNSSERELLQGMVIPFGLITFVLIGYGGMQIIVRPKHIIKVSDIYKENPNFAIEKEFNKSNKDDRLFKLLKIIWPIGLAISIVLYIILSKLYLEGLSIGLIVLFGTLYIVDSFLHKRLKIYIKGIDSILKYKK